MDKDKWYEADQRRIALEQAASLARDLKVLDAQWVIQTAETFLAFLEPQKQGEEQDPRTLI